MLAGCKEDKYNVIIPMSDIYLSAPQDGAIIDLNDLSIEKYSFSWEKPLENGAKLLICTDRKFKEPVIIDAGKSTSVAISALTADQSFSQLGIKAGQEAVLYWTVKETGNITAAASEARTIRVKRMTSKLVQPEDLTKISLAENAPETAVQFEWDTQEWPESTSYSLCFSLDPEMKQTVAEHSVGVVNGKSSLTQEELVIKYAVLRSEPFFDALRAEPVSAQVEHVIATCVGMKRDLVAADEFDRGSRQLLNLGHSFGHAVEKCSDYAVPHGCGVAIGMAIIARAAAKRGICTDDTCAQILALLRQYGLPTETAFTRDALTDAARSDKKIADGKLHLIVPERIGRCRIETIPAADIPAWLADGGIA